MKTFWPGNMRIFFLIMPAIWILVTCFVCLCSQVVIFKHIPESRVFFEFCFSVGRKVTKNGSPYVLNITKTCGLSSFEVPKSDVSNSPKRDMTIANPGSALNV